MAGTSWGQWVRHLYDDNAVGYAVLVGTLSGIVFFALGFVWGSESMSQHISSGVIFGILMGLFYFYRSRKHQKKQDSPRIGE